MAILTTRPRGTNDFLPAETPRWQYVERTLLSTAALYGYGEIRTPTFEHTELFQRGVGDTTDVVNKEMYTFTDKGDRSITLRPEGTASAAPPSKMGCWAMPYPSRSAMSLIASGTRRPSAAASASSTSSVWSATVPPGPSPMPK